LVGFDLTLPDVLGSAPYELNPELVDLRSPFVLVQLVQILVNLQHLVGGAFPTDLRPSVIAFLCTPADANAGLARSAPPSPPPESV
jgi:hypothetical protein